MLLGGSRLPDAIFIAKFNTQPKNTHKVHLSTKNLWYVYQINDTDVTRCSVHCFIVNFKKYSCFNKLQITSNRVAKTTIL